MLPVAIMLPVVRVVRYKLTLPTFTPDHASLTAKTKKSPPSTAQNTAVTTSTSLATTQHSTAPTTAIHKTTSFPQHNDTCAAPTTTGALKSASRASRTSTSKSSAQKPTRPPFNPENMTDADREAAATLITLSESDHSTNSSLNSSRSSSFAVPQHTPAQGRRGAITTVPDAGRYSSSLFGGVIASAGSQDFIARTLSRNIAGFATSSNSAAFATSSDVASSTAHGMPMDSTNPSTSTPRKRSRDIDDDTYGASHSAIHSSSPPAPKRRSVSPTITPAAQAVPVPSSTNEQIGVNQAFALGADYVYQYIRERGYFALGEDLRAKIAGEMQDATAGANDSTLADGVAEGIEKRGGTGAKGFWDVV